MKKLIYYPSFEIKHPDWLKFALLYIDELRPIIPQEGDKYLSADYREIIDKTDLIKQYRPDPTEGTPATLDAIEIVEKILQNPKRYSSSLGNSDFIEKWREDENQNYTIFEKKYTNAWEDFCIDNQLGKRNDEGIAVSRTLGLIYMSFLTNVISEAKNIPLVTDHQDLDNISILARITKSQTDEKINIAKGIIELKTPKNLEHISLETIINHRKGQGFKERLHAFHLDFEKYLIDLESGKAEKGFLDKRYEGVKEFNLALSLLGIELEVFCLSTWFVTTNPESWIARGIQFLTGTKTVIKGIQTVNKHWKHTKNTRFSRKYLADLSQLK